MNSNRLNWFLSCYIFLGIAFFFVSIDKLLISGIFGGFAVFFRTLVSIPLPPAIHLVQERPIWKWFSVIYLFVLLIWLMKNMGSEYIYQLNPVLATFVFCFPFIFPYALNEYKIYKQLKSKK